MNERDIFDAALALDDPAKQAAYLDEACSADASQRKRLEEMLEAHRRLGSFLEQPAVPLAPTIEQPVTERPGMQIGPYKLLQEIGHGGMGMVFMAEQHEPVRRKVALKIIKPGMDTRQVLARFEAERQALSLMDHPNIAKVLDAGTTSSGRPYFVMELVKGQPITQYCDENKLTPRQRLELLLPVCHAIQHAHQKGIIHRDIKPSNILVAEYDQKPVPKVIDFGVAKATSQPLTDRTMFTGFGQVVGTLEYMSPEQAKVNQLDIDTRSDIYSLGVLMYELLTGSTPFDRKRLKQAAWDEMLRIIREEDPPKPSTRLFDSKDSLPSISAQRHTDPAKLTKLVRGELDWIVMKALEKDRSRRYETANGFAMDLQRYLNDEAVSACPPSVGYRMRKFVRRNKAAIFTIFTVILVLVIGIVISTWQAYRATQAESLAESRWIKEQSARREAEQAKHEANINFERARDAVQKMLTRVADKDIVDVPRMGPVRRALLEEALKFNEQLLSEKHNDPELRLATANAHLQLAWSKTRSLELKGLDVSYQKAVDLLEALAKDFPHDIRYQAALAWGLAQSTGRRNDPASEVTQEHIYQLYLRAISLQESVVAARPDSINDAYNLADMLHNLAKMHYWSKRYKEAESTWRRVGTLSEEYLKKDSLHAAHLRTYIRAYTSLGEMLISQDPAQAESLLSLASKKAAHFESILKRDGYLADISTSALATLERTWENLHRWRGKLSLARDACKREIEILERYLRDYPSDIIYQRILGEALVRMAELNAQSSNNAEAQHYYQQALERIKLSCELAPEVHGVWHLLGDVYYQLKQHEIAIQNYSKAITINPKSAWSWRDRGLCYSILGQYESAVKDYRRAIELTPENSLFRHEYGEVLKNLANAKPSQENKQQLEDYLFSTRRELHAQVDKSPTDYTTQEQLGTFLLWQLRPYYATIARKKEQEDCTKEALAIFEKLTKQDNGQLWLYWMRLGEVQAYLNLPEKALGSLTRSIELNPNHHAAWYWRGEANAALNQLDKAIEDFSKAIAIDPDHVWSWRQRAWNYTKLGQWDKAVADYQQALKRDSTQQQFHYDYGIALEKTGKDDEALESFRKALELATIAEPNNPEYKRKYNEFKAIHQQRKAVSDLRKAIEQDPRNPAKLRDLGIHYDKQANFTDALITFQKVIQLEPEKALNHNNLGIILLKLKKPQDAIAAFRKAIELDPKYSRAHHALAEILMNTNDHPGAITAYRKLLDLDPKSAGAMNNLAWMLLTAGDVKLRNTQEALTLSRKAVELTKDNWVNLDTHSLAAYRNGLWQESLDSREKMIKIRQPRTEDKFFLAMCLWNLERKEEAKKHYAEAAAEFAKLPRPDTWLTEIKKEAETLLGSTTPSTKSVK